MIHNEFFLVLCCFALGLLTKEVATGPAALYASLGQSQPTSPDTGFQCPDGLFMPHSPEPYHILQLLAIISSTSRLISCSEETRSSQETLNEVVPVRDELQKIEKWSQLHRKQFIEMCKVLRLDRNDKLHRHRMHC